MYSNRLSIDRVSQGFHIGFPLAIEPIGEVKTLEILGTFTGWEPRELFHKDQNHWSLFLPFEKVQVPGNTGLPEFSFRVNGQYWYGYDFYLPTEYVLHKRLIALVSNDQEAKHWQEIQPRVNRWDKNLQGREALANFRMVVPKVLGGRLMRSYHPFLPSKLGHPQEGERLEAVGALMEIHKPGCLINLSDSPEDLRHHTLPKVYQDLFEQGRVGFFQTDYEEVYYRSDSEAFLSTLLGVLKFISLQEGPFWIHCRLGVDRTGVLSGFLAGFAGAVWEEIAADYELSNRLGLLEYRNKALLGHSLSLFLGQDVSSIRGPIFSHLTKSLELRSGGDFKDLVGAVRKKLNQQKE